MVACMIYPNIIVIDDNLNYRIVHGLEILHLCFMEIHAKQLVRDIKMRKIMHQLLNIYITVLLSMKNLYIYDFLDKKKEYAEEN